jgi:plasmid maintenance system antidote protein VapI
VTRYHYLERMSWHLSKQIALEGMTQKAMAEQVGITEKHMSQLCTGRVKLSIDVAVRIGRALNLNWLPGLLLAMQVRDELDEYYATHPGLKPDQEPNPDIM